MLSLTRRTIASIVSVTAILLSTPASPPPLAQAQAQTHITTPKEEFGANFGDDYFLANYKQISTYWRKLATQSNRIVVQEIGTMSLPGKLTTDSLSFKAMKVAMKVLPAPQKA